MLLEHAENIQLNLLQGFVSNKTSEVGDESVDPFEPLLYNLFLANSSRLDQARLADILGVELHQLLLATSIAIRLGFATRLSPGSSGAVDELGELGGRASNVRSLACWQRRAQNTDNSFVLRPHGTTYLQAIYKLAAKFPVIIVSVSRTAIFRCSFERSLCRHSGRQPGANHP